MTDSQISLMEPAAPQNLGTGQPQHNPVVVYLTSLTSPRSRQTMRNDLAQIAQMIGGDDALSFPWHTLEYAHTNELKSRLAAKYAPSTANRMLCAVRGVLKACWRLGLMPDAQYARATDVQSIKGTRVKRSRMLSRDELKRLFAACQRDVSPAGPRDAAIIALLAGGGLRREEVSALQMSDINPEFVHPSGADVIKLIINGKGNKQRTMYAANGSKTALDAWLAIRGNEPGAIFLPIDRYGAIKARAMSHQAIYDVVQKRIAQAWISDVTPHDFRHTWISGLFDMGVDIKTIQEMAGHRDINTTAAYDRRGETAKVDASKLISVPY